MALKRRILNLLGDALVAVMLGGSLTMMLCRSFGMDASAFWVYLAGACAAVLCAAACLSRGARVAAGACAAVAAVGFCLSPARPLQNVAGFLRELAGFGAGGEWAIGEYGAVIQVAVGALLSALFFWLAHTEGGVYPAITLAVVALMGCWLISEQIYAGYSVAVLAALAAMFSRASGEKFSYMRALPVGLVAAILAIMLIPAGNPVWPPLQNGAEWVRQLFNDYFLFTTPRATYSISSDGYQPQGELLGGPANPTEQLVMEVNSDQSLLLRGSIKRTYTTYSWTENAVNSRYLLNDPIRRCVREQVFDEERSKGQAALVPAQANIQMLGDGISALFVTHRLNALSSEIDMVPYFSTNGEVFITRGVEAGDRYSFESFVEADDREAMRRWTQSVQGDARYGEALRDYMQLPKGIEQGVYELVSQIAGGIEAPYDRALAIEQYLLSNHTYRLDVPYPPRNRDFVSYFLLEGKEGYCSYFASAMAVMARIAGLPSRYIEGYAVGAEPSGTAIVTGENAHAWVEIYFDGAGWVSFDPTPGDGGARVSHGGSGADASGQEEGDEGGEAALPTEEPAAEPTPEPAPDDPSAGEEEGEAAPTEEPEDSPDQTPPPEEEEPEPDPPGEPERDEAERPNLTWLWWTLLLLAAAALSAYLCHIRLRAADPRFAQARYESRADRLLLWYRALLLLLARQGHGPLPDETPTAFAARLKEVGAVGDAFVYVSEQVALNRYAGRTPEAAVMRRAEEAYRQLVAQLRWTKRLGWLYARLTRGLGDIQSIP